MQRSHKRLLQLVFFLANISACFGKCIPRNILMNLMAIKCVLVLVVGGMDQSASFFNTDSSQSERSIDYAWFFVRNETCIF